MTEDEEIKLYRFVRQMAIEQNNNSHKGSILAWEGLEEKVFDFDYHKGKLMLAIKEENKDAIKEFIADCANILLSIGEEFDLYEKESTNSERTNITKDSVFREVTLEEAEEQRRDKHNDTSKNTFTS